jgi:hypothetical protein
MVSLLIPAIRKDGHKSTLLFEEYKEICHRNIHTAGPIK